MILRGQPEELQDSFEMFWVINVVFVRHHPKKLK